MRDGRWRFVLAPAVVAAATVALVFDASLPGVQGAEESPSQNPPVVAGCTPPAAGVGAWYRLDERVDRQAGLAGYTLRFGSATSKREAALAVPSESFAAGPFGGVLVVGTDDGRSSSVRLVVAGSGCAAVALTTTDVVRRATLDPDGRFLYTHRVSRRGRADLGVWRDSLSTLGRPTRVLGPLDGRAAQQRRGFERVFSTEFQWNGSGHELAVQTCGAAECVTRTVDTTTGATATYDAPGQGELLAVTDASVVTYEACGGTPCGIRATNRATRGTQLIAAGAGAAVATNAGSAGTLVYETVGGPGNELAAVDLASGATRTIHRSAAGGLNLVPSAPRALAAVTVPAGTVAVAADGQRVGRDIGVLRLADATLARLEDQ